MRKINNMGFFLVETMVVIAVVGIVLTYLFKTFSSVYTRFNMSEYYNTVAVTNAAGDIKQYIDKLGISYEDIIGANAYVDITDDSNLINDYYAMLKSKLKISNIYLINVQTFFDDANNLKSFKTALAGYLKTLEDDAAQYKIVVVNQGNEYGSISAFDYYLTLTGNVNEEYATYVPLNGTFTDPGYESKDNEGNNLDVTVTGVVSTSTAGIYYLNYNVGAISMRRKVVVYKQIYNFDYTGSYQVFTAPVSGKYQIELWGAQVPSGNGKGAYTNGNIYLLKGQILYIYVGESSAVQNAETFNCGTASANGYPGGGATDVRLVSGNWKNVNSLKSRIMIAGGAGAGNIAGSHGGALTGLYPGVATGGTQTAGGTAQNVAYYPASFGIGGGGCGGGGGYYGGGGASCASGGAGGSSFISGYTGCNAITPTGGASGQQYHYSGFRFADTQIIAGNATMPNPRGTGTIVGNNGAGYARITLLNVNSNNSLKKVRFIYNQTNGSTANTENHYVELQAFDMNGVNVALGKTTVSASVHDGDAAFWTQLTDGVTTSNPYIYTALGTLSWFRLDLGAEYDLSSIRLWHYYADGRTYYQDELRVAGSDLVFRTINNTNYPESANGFIIKPVSVD